MGWVPSTELIVSSKFSATFNKTQQVRAAKAEWGVRVLVLNCWTGDLSGSWRKGCGGSRSRRGLNRGQTTCSFVFNASIWLETRGKINSSSATRRQRPDGGWAWSHDYFHYDNVKISYCCKYKDWSETETNSHPPPGSSQFCSFATPPQQHSHV